MGRIPVCLLWICALAACGAADLKVASGSRQDTAPGGASAVIPPTDSVSADSSDSSDSSLPPDPAEATDALELCVNEWVASNAGGLRLVDGTRPDWIELYNPGTIDVELDGWVLSDSDDPEDGSILDGSMRIPPSSALVLFADGRTELGSRHLDLSLDDDGETVALFAPDGRGEVVHYGAVDPDMALARRTDCCRGEDDCWSFVRHGTPGVGNTDEGDARVFLVGAESQWRYLDTNEAPDAAWTTPEFSDAAWARGVGPFGFGDSHQITTVASGPDGGRHISTWFRQTFYPDDPEQLHDLELQLMLDDGARVWLNGTELLRVNLPTDVDVDPTTLASVAVGGSNETAVIRYAIDGAVLLETANVLAIEVHQASLTSSDLGMHAELSALRL